MRGKLPNMEYTQGAYLKSTQTYFSKNRYNIQ